MQAREQIGPGRRGRLVEAEGMPAAAFDRRPKTFDEFGEGSATRRKSPDETGREGGDDRKPLLG
ncbi:MAG: hypothetical protein ABSB70_15685 [Candidatus Velthaea sp.]